MRAYNDGRRVLGMRSKAHSKPGNWLKLIEDVDSGNPKSTSFTAYRRAMDAINFPLAPVVG